MNNGMLAQLQAQGARLLHAASSDELVAELKKRIGQKKGLIAAARPAENEIFEIFTLDALAEQCRGLSGAKGRLDTIAELAKTDIR